jgi:hypothetical protein
MVFQNPVVTTSRVTRDAQHLPAASGIRSVDWNRRNIVTEVRGIPVRSKRWIALEVFNTLEPRESPTFGNRHVTSATDTTDSLRRSGTR